MPDLTQTTWFPVVTLLIGIGTTSLTDWIKYRRDVTRERESREATRKEQRFERRVTFQRQTLLELQEACVNLARATGASHHKDGMAFRETGKWQKQLLPEDLDEEYRLCQVRVQTLSVRVRDDDIRKLAKELRENSAAVVVSSNERDGGRAMASMTATHQLLNERVGVILREIDDAAE
jgi:hypothetical protein